ncbi:hypothetical protein ACIBF1_30315 [Spirillospora sp. NPDC050679]
MLRVRARGGYLHHIPIEVAVRFTAEELPDPQGVHVPFADRGVRPDAACPRCGCLSDRPGYGPGEMLVWECERCGRRWQTLARPESPECAQADAVAELVAAAARARAGTAQEAATERVRRAALASRATSVTARRTKPDRGHQPRHPGPLGPPPADRTAALGPGDRACDRGIEMPV